MPATPVDRDSGVMLWQQVYDDLDRRVSEGEFTGADFPTEHQLAATYGVSRRTVRRALRSLNEFGLLHRVPGRGTTLNTAEFIQPLGNGIYSLHDLLAESGVDCYNKVLRLEVLRNEAAAARLDLAPGEEFVMLERLRYAGGKPLAVDCSWMPLSLARPLLDVDWTRAGVYSTFEDLGLPVPDRGIERIAITLPSALERERLEISHTVPVFALERIGCVGGREVEWRHAIIRGDRFQFESNWDCSNPMLARPRGH